MSEQAPFYIFTAFVLTYVVGTLKLTRGFALNGVLLAAVLSLFSIPFFGWLSDVVGRKRVYLAGVIVTGLWAFPYFWLLNSKASLLVLLAIVLSLIPHDMQYGPQAAFIAENFTGRLRYSGASIGYQLASIVAGGPAPLIAVALLAAYHTYVPIALYIVACAVISLIATVLMPDRSRVDLTREYDAERVPPEAVRRMTPAG